jgi:hypothetical protein
MYGLRTLWPEAGIPGLLVGILTANIIAIALAEFGEKRHRKLAHYIRHRLSAAGLTVPVASGGNPGCDR